MWYLLFEKNRSVICMQHAFVNYNIKQGSVLALFTLWGKWTSCFSILLGNIGILTSEAMQWSFFLQIVNSMFVKKKKKMY